MVDLLEMNANASLRCWKNEACGKRRMTEDEPAAPSENTVRDKTAGGSGAKLPQAASRSRGKSTEVACNDDVSSGQGEMLSHPPGGGGQS